MQLKVTFVDGLSDSFNRKTDVADYWNRFLAPRAWQVLHLLGDKLKFHIFGANVLQVESWLCFSKLRQLQRLSSHVGICQIKNDLFWHRFFPIGACHFIWPLREVSARFARFRKEGVQMFFGADVSVVAVAFQVT